MLKLKFSLMSVVTLIATVFIMSSCAQDDIAPNTNEISDEVSAKFSELGFDVSDIKRSSQENPITGKVESGFILENDIMISDALFEEMLKSDVAHEGACGEQYRTNNLVSTPQTISVLGYTGGSYALDNTMRTALSWAVDNYNALNIGLNFSLSYGTNTGSADIVVYRVSGGGGGSAGFPSGGNPYKWVQILSGTSSYGTNTTEHVITHEIGHCLGLRHTDYFNRSLSCGSGGNEGDGGVGAIHIPGTPTGFDANSIMLSCFSANEDGEFGNYDVVALEYLY
ncbi:zinc-dependent metalloprotease [Marinoscillum pacificum]|uniref:zinc-dependent metalloprotease n=1 Tax=Marinoscillum pacificum TaxID=392723 RepID=UPI0021586694|nr:zinc-dependent metalloprotease [Marinoscillum pacificum]